MKNRMKQLRIGGKRVAAKVLLYLELHSHIAGCTLPIELPTKRDLRRLRSRLTQRKINRRQVGKDDEAPCRC